MNYEEPVAAIWREVLGRPDADVSRGFFAAGGDPLLAAQVVSRIRRVWGVHIPVADFLENGTVAALARAVASGVAQSEAGPATGPAAITRRAPDAAAPLSFDQQRIWLENQLLPGEAYNVHGRRRLIGELDVGVLEASVRAIIARHETLRTRFPVVDGSPVQVVDEPDPSWRLTVTDVSLQDDPAEAARRAADAEAAQPFDLVVGPLFRCSVIKVSTDEHVLAVTVHHIVSDAWSIRLFVQELAALYTAGADVRRAGLATLPVQYRDYAVWQRERLAGGALKELVAYWRGHLDGAPAALMLPAARRRSTIRQADGRRLRDELSREETAALLQACREHGGTVFMALLAGLSTVLGRWSGQDDVVIGVPVAGRNNVGTGKLIGFFVNTLPVRVKVPAGGSGVQRAGFGESVARARKAAVDGFAHADAPLDVLVQELQPARDPRRTPLFQVILNVIDSPIAERISSLRVEPMDSPVLPPIVDLVVTAQQVEGSLRLQVDFDAERYPDDLVDALVRQLHGWLVGAGGEVPSTLAPSFGTAQAASAPLLARLPELSVSDDIGGFIDWLKSSAVSAVYLTAPMLRAIAGRQPELPALRSVFVDNAGDFVAHDVEALRRLAPECRCVGVYRAGPEARPVALFDVPDQWSAESAPLRVPLGKPGTGVDGSIRLRHSRGEPARIGEVGEIWSGEYRTGDLGRLWPDGSLEFAGRRDAESALDYADTAAALRDLPAVADAVVTRHEAPDGTAVLVGHVVSRAAAAGSGAVLSPADLRRHLVPLLPEYLIPDKFVVVDELPLTAEGRYDLHALPAPDMDDESADTYEAARTPMERRLVEFLQELLGVERVGVHDGFFDLGGFSLLATRLAANIQSEFGVELRLRDLFTAPTVEELARLIVQTQAELAGEADLEALLAQIEAA